MNKTYAISDLHGNKLLWDAGRAHLDKTDVLYVLGDCADRGPHGWQIIKGALVDPRVRYIRGNHDQFILDAWRSEWTNNYLWYSNGGYETFNDLMMDVNYEKYLIQLARTKLYHCYENKEGQRIHLSHAGFTLMENDEIPNKVDLLWDREHCWDACDWWPESNPKDYVVHGHTPVVSSTFKNLVYGAPDLYKINDSNTVCRYAHGYKICIDGRSFLTNQCALLDLDTLQETVIKVEQIEMS